MSKNRHKGVIDAPVFHNPSLLTTIPPTVRVLESEIEGRIVADTGTPRHCYFRRGVLCNALIRMLDSLALV